MISYHISRLGSLCKFVSGGTPSRKTDRYYTGEMPWITGADIIESSISEVRLFITDEAIANSATSIMPPDSILLVTRTGVGKVAIADREICISQDFTGLIPNNKLVDTKYLFRYLQASKPNLIKFQRGATIKGVTREVVANLEVPLPPLPEQKRIAAILDKADAVRRNRQEAIRLTEAFLRSVFLDMFGDPVTNPKGWEVVKLKALIRFLTSGSRGWAKYYSNSGSLFLRIQNLKNIQIALDDIAYVRPPDSAEARRTKVEVGDLLLSITADLGRTAVVPENLGPAHINQHLAILRLKREEIIPLYAAWYLSSVGGQRQMQRLNRQGVKAGLNFDDIKSLDIVLPPSSEQARFREIVEKHTNSNLRISNAYDLHEQLFSSLVKRAFRGEL